MKPLLRLLCALTFSSAVLACGGGDSSSPPGADSDAESDASPLDATSSADGNAIGDAATGADTTVERDATSSADAGEMTDADAASNDEGDAPNDAEAGADGAQADAGSADTGSSTDGMSDDAAPDGSLGGNDASSDEDATTTDAAASDASDTGTVEPYDASDGGAPVDSGPPPDAGTIDYVTGVMVSTLAGSGVAGSQDGTGAAAQFNDPTGMAIDAQGNLLVTDYTGSLVRRVTPQGVVTTLAKASTFLGPFAAVVATNGAYYVQTDFNSSGVKNATSGTIWLVTPLDDGGVATPTLVAQGFARPRGLAPIAGGNLFVSDHVAEIVETLTVADGGVAFVAGTADDAGFQDGTGAGAQFNWPIGAATLADGSVLVADRDNNRIRRVDSAGVVTTFAGDGAPGVNDGPRLGAEFSLPCDVAVDAAGNVYVSDAGNHRIRRIRTDGDVDTLGGDGTAGFNDGAGQGAEFYGQEGIDVTPDGSIVYLTDGNSGDGSPYNRVRAIAIP